jgi:hypothetical protein
MHVSDKARRRRGKRPEAAPRRKAISACASSTLANQIGEPVRNAGKLGNGLGVDLRQEAGGFRQFT